MAASDCNRIIESLGGTIPAPAADSYKEKDVTLQPCDPATFSPEDIRIDADFSTKPPRAWVALNESPIMNDQQIDAVADAAPAIEEAEPVTTHTSAEDILAKLGW
jgi:hypothetical protein